MRDNEAKTRIIARRLSLAVNVKDAGELPKLGGNIRKFLAAVDVDHGPFDIDIGLSVNRDGDASDVMPKDPESSPMDIVFIPAYEEGEE